MPTEFSELQAAFVKIVQTGTEEEARTFLLSQLKKFPPATRDQLVLAFAEEALGRQGTEAEFVTNFQKEGLAAAKVLVTEKDLLEAKEKLLS